MDPVIETERLYLREWTEKDVRALVEMNKDPQVMHYFPSTLTEAETLAMLERIKAGFKNNGFSFFACVLKESDECIGFVGLSIPGLQMPFTPCVEIGWRLQAKHQGKGYATEAARAVLKYGFEDLGLKEIVSFTPEGNTPSRRVMGKIGMTRNPAEDFVHPKYPEGHVFVLYRISKEQWQKLEPMDCVSTFG